MPRTAVEKNRNGARANEKAKWHDDDEHLHSQLRRTSQAIHGVELSIIPKRKSLLPTVVGAPQLQFPAAALSQPQHTIADDDTQPSRLNRQCGVVRSMCPQMKINAEGKSFESMQAYGLDVPGTAGLACPTKHMSKRMSKHMFQPTSRHLSNTYRDTGVNACLISKHISKAYV